MGGQRNYLDDIETGQVVICASVGWLIHDGDDVKTLAPNIGALAGNYPQVCGVMRIPACSIVQLLRLDEPRLTSSLDGVSSASSAPLSHPETAPSQRAT